MNHVAKARKVIQLEIDELTRLLDRIGDSFTAAVDALQETITGGGKIVVLGVGKSGNIGRKISATLNSTGATSVILSSQDALHGDLGLVNDGDAIIALSRSGETEEISRILPHLRRFRVHIIGFTGNPDSVLARGSDIALDVNVEREACPLNLAPTSSTTVMLALGDALAMVLLEARGFKDEDFAKLHPGGSIGSALLTKVSEIMRTGDEMATVAPDATVQVALAAMTKCRGGATVIANPGAALSGIFTQGDFARAFQSDPNLATKTVAEFMTADPISIRKDELAAAALQLFDAHRIDDLVVVDENNRPVGLVDTQDLSRFRLV